MTLQCVEFQLWQICIYNLEYVHLDVDVNMNVTSKCTAHDLRWKWYHVKKFYFHRLIHIWTNLPWMVWNNVNSRYSLFAVRCVANGVNSNKIIFPHVLHRARMEKLVLATPHQTWIAPNLIANKVIRHLNQTSHPLW